MNTEFFEARHKPIVDQFIFTGVMFSIANTLKTREEIDEFMEVISEKCFSHGIGVVQIQEAVNIISESIKAMVDILKLNKPTQLDEE